MLARHLTLDIRYRLSDINVTEVDEATVFEKSRCASERPSVCVCVCVMCVCDVRVCV